ncbi:hypothetical protein ABZ543_08100 [Streptomyces roseifaciens]
MSDFIHVRPTTARRRDFAVWATAQRPKVRTVSTHTFAVPASLFVQAPEAVLIGALVDGHRYVSPQEDDDQDHEGAGSDSLAPAPETGPPYACGACDRDDFQTERGRDTHRRRLHAEGA